jgi:hypothetical protein
MPVRTLVRGKTVAKNGEPIEETAGWGLNVALARPCRP